MNLTPYQEEINKAQEEAKSKKIGVWSEDQKYI